MNPGNVTITASLVPYLRNGVKREYSATLASLTFQIETALEPATYRDALARFDEVRALFDAVGVSDEPHQRDLELDLGRWPLLLLRALESEYDVEVMRLQDHSAEGLDLSLGEVPALGSLVADIRKKVEAPSTRRREQALTQDARRQTRSRGDG